MIKRCKNSCSFFPPLGDLARDPLPRSWNKETSFTVSVKIFVFVFFFDVRAFTMAPLTEGLFSSFFDSRKQRRSV